MRRSLLCMVCDSCGGLWTRMVRWIAPFQCFKYNDGKAIRSNCVNPSSIGPFGSVPCFIVSLAFPYGSAVHRACPTARLKMFCYIYTQWTPAETYLETIVKYIGKRTWRIRFFQTLEGIFTTKVPGPAQMPESTFCTFQIVWTLHPDDDLLDHLTVFFSNLYHSAI